MSHENLKHIQSKVWVCAHQSRLCWSEPSGTNYRMISPIDTTVSWLRNTIFYPLYTRSCPFQLPSSFGAVLVLLSYTLAYLIPEIVSVATWIWATFWKCPSPLKCLPSFVILYCPPVATHRTTVAPLPVFWGARPVAVASRGTWTTLLFLTFLTWVAFCARSSPRPWCELDACSVAVLVLFLFSALHPAGRPDLTVCLRDRGDERLFVTRLSLKCVFNTWPVVLCLTNCLLSKPCFLISVLKKPKIECVAFHSH